MVHIALIPVGPYNYTLQETCDPPIDNEGHAANYTVNHKRRQILLWASALDKPAYAATATSECWRDVFAPIPVNQNEVWPSQ